MWKLQRRKSSVIISVFYNYEYALDVTKQLALMSGTKPLADGLKEAYDWYVVNQDKVNKKPYLAYIEEHLV